MTIFWRLSPGLMKILCHQPLFLYQPWQASRQSSCLQAADNASTEASSRICSAIPQAALGQPTVHADPHILDRDKRVLAGFEFFHVKMTRQPSLIYDIDGFCVGLVPDRLMRSIVAPTRRKRKRFQVPFGGAAQAGPPRRGRPGAFAVAEVLPRWVLFSPAVVISRSCWLATLRSFCLVRQNKGTPAAVIPIVLTGPKWYAGIFI